MLPVSAVGLRYASPNLATLAMDRGFSVERRYELLGDDGQPIKPKPEVKSDKPGSASSDRKDEAPAAKDGKVSGSNRL